MKWIMIEVATKNIIEVAENKFPVHPNYIWIEFDEKKYPMDMSNCRDWKYDGKNFIEPEPWLEFPGISVADAKIKKKEMYERAVKNSYTKNVDPFYLEYHRKSLRKLSIPDIPKELIEYENNLRAVWKKTQSDIDAKTTVKDIATYKPEWPKAPFA